MSKKSVDALKSAMGDAVLSTNDFRGDDEVTVASKDWHRVAEHLKSAGFNHFTDLTAVDFPEREPDGPRFDVLLFLRNMATAERIRVRTSVEDGAELATLSDVWGGANWAEREVWDMFGIKFAGHPDLRRILMYDEFEGYPLRKDYPIERAQPLVPYRNVPGIAKLPPFGVDMGQPWARNDWSARVSGEDHQVSPAIAVQTGQKRNTSDSEIAVKELERINANPPAEQPASEE